MLSFRSLATTCLCLGVLFLSSCDSTGLPQEGLATNGSALTRTSGARALPDSLLNLIVNNSEIVGAGTTEEYGVSKYVVLVKTAPETWETGKKERLPSNIKATPVKSIVTGEMYGPRESSDEASSNGAMEFSRPVPIGVSVGIPNGPTGTIGARVSDSANLKYLLTNNHVIANSNNYMINEAIIQPGPSDGGMEALHTIGHLSSYVSINFDGTCNNTVDAAIALVNSNELASSTTIGGYGMPKQSTIFPSTGLKIMKYGRTSGLTFGEVIATNAIVQVNYGSAGIACFSDQIIVSPGTFSDNGDSGSLIVTDSENPSDSRHPVGLLFAGSETITVANPINAVLSAFDVVVDGDAEVPNESSSTDSKKLEICHQANGGSSDRTISVAQQSWPAHQSHGDYLGTCTSDDWVADAQLTGEVMIKVVDSSDSYVSGVSICAYSTSSSADACATSTNGVDPYTLDGAFNWNAEMEGNNPQPFSMTLSNGTKYVLHTANSTNALYIERESGDNDVWVLYSVSNVSTGAGTFSITERTASFDAAIVTPTISNVTVSSPRNAGSAVDIEWDSVWSGSGYTFPTSVSGPSKVVLVNGGTSTLASPVSDGTGEYEWTPTIGYTGVKIKVQSLMGEGSAESSSFDVAPAVSFTIEGPVELEENVTGTWSVLPTGGTSPYSYDWEYMLICNTQSVSIRLEECGTWNQGGTSSSWSHSIPGYDFDLKIRLKVTDSQSPSDSNEKEITVDMIEAI